MPRMLRSNTVGTKTVRVGSGPWKRARICAIESGTNMQTWMAEAIALKADLQEQAGRLRRRGAKVAVEATVLEKVETTHE